jgi:acyl transferase domain-containing protein
VIPIAVVGIDCRFPGAPDKTALWRLMVDGVVTDTEVPSQRWDVDTYYHPDGVVGSTNTRRGHFIDDVDAFDNEFFGIAPLEAGTLDPQQRLLLQTSWRALEDAGVDPRSMAGTPTGVFVGLMSAEWGNLAMLDYAGLTSFSGAGSGSFMSANRISYHLNLTGPSMAIDTACSSSLIAVHQGCAALRSGDADTVIAAGANIMLLPALSIFYTQAGLSAPDGRCKPYGQSADGIGRGEGVAAVVLRRLDDAIADGQPIYAVVRSSVANHDGRSNGVTAPSRRAQAALIRRALSLAEVDAGQITFTEGHGTGTILGDMIEVSALGDVHVARGGAACLLGSIKGNIGHTEGSAGIAAFIKACLALHHRLLPPTIFGDSPRAELRLDERGLRLADGPQELPPSHVLGAVSSFGLGGSNAHAVLESAPAAPPFPSASTGVVTISAPSEPALRRNVDAIVPVLERLDDRLVTSWCRTTNQVKRSLRHRLVVHGNRSALVGSLQGFLAGTRPELASSVPLRKGQAGVGLLCPGQGTQFPGMTRPLYDANPCYRRHLDAAAAALRPHLKADPLALILGGGPGIHHTSLAQPALFAVSYALGKTLLESGIRPMFGIGHSVGEVAAACLAGVLSLDEASMLVAVRGRLMGSMPPDGTMIAIDLGVDQAEMLVAATSGCVVAAVNGPRSVVISGESDAVNQFHDAVRVMGAKAVQLTVSHAFHSPLMEPVAADLRRELAGLTPGTSQFPLYSTVRGREVAGHEMDVDYWADQICSPVRFLDAIQSAAGVGGVDYIAEAGPRSTLLTLARQCGVLLHTQSLTLCRGPDSDGTELLGAAAALLRDGHVPDLSPLYGSPAGPLHRIAPYVFDTSNRFWRASGVTAPAPARSADVTVAGPHQTARIPAGRGAALIALVADVGGYPAAEVARSSRLVDDLGYDSLLQLRLLKRLRSEYPELEHMSVSEVLPYIDRVGALVDFVVARLDNVGTRSLV